MTHPKERVHNQQACLDHGLRALVVVNRKLHSGGSLQLWKVSELDTTIRLREILRDWDTECRATSVRSA
jgi:hypothetical protein